MSSITADGRAPSVDLTAGDVGPLERQHLQYANYRAVAGGTEVTKTHWHIALANALGWGFDGMAGMVAANFGWRVAVMVPGVIALLAIYVRARCPESPYWVRAQDRKRRIAETIARGGAVNADDSTWFGKAKSVGIRQAFMPDV